MDTLKKILYTRKPFVIFITLFLGWIILFLIFSTQSILVSQKTAYLWQFQSIDAMKYSRDLAREKLHDPVFVRVIDAQVDAIEKTGATHIAIATPYDDEFLPYLKAWVVSARKHNLHVWFRGNWSGWEKWFGYASINREEHIKKTKQFIINNKDLFQNGDVFSACPECENGGPGDPRKGDVDGFRQFIISEYQVTKKAFESIHKKVESNYVSMNADVARLVMDTSTTKALDGIVTIDHYVASPEKMISDVHEISQKSGGKVVIGEFGAPVPDIHGDMTEQEQAAWIKKTLELLANSPDVVGVNYWVNVGGSTELWSDSGVAKQGVLEITKIYHSPQIIGQVLDVVGNPVKNAKVTHAPRFTLTDNGGDFVLPYLGEGITTISAKGYKEQNIYTSNTNKISIRLQPEKMSFWMNIQVFFYSLFRRL